MLQNTSNNITALNKQFKDNKEDEKYKIKQFWFNVLYKIARK